MPISDCIILIY